MFKPQHNCNRQQSHAQNSPSKAETIRELLDVQAGFRKGRGTRDQIASISWIIEKAREFQKKIYFCFTEYAKAFDCVNHNKLRTILKEMEIPDHLTCPLRNIGLKLNIQKMKIKASGPITSWQIESETMESVTDYFLGLQSHCRWWLQPWN